ncbi:MAG: ATP-binding protein [Cyanobacteriota bacterium]|nr:ATP-binding protein [Cyanobacteriota bacterium]
MASEIYRVLLVDDDEDDYIVTRDFLSEAERVTFKLSWVDNYKAGLAAIKTSEYDVYLLDFRLGPENGLELLQEAVKFGCTKPIILLTGVGDHDIDRQAIAFGASDYLVKGSSLNAALLERSIIHAVERKRAEICQAQLMSELAIANQELKDFAHIVSHDLKAPLRGIASLADWLIADYQHRLDPEGQEMLQLMGERVLRMSDLIDGVLQYSQVGRVRERKTKVDLNQVVAEVIDAIAPPEGIQIRVETHLPIVFVERTHIQQVFQNLISNGVKYMGQSKGLIKICHLEKGGYWQFSVADTGKGIEERHFKKIFQIFQTLTPSNRSESTGVGLTIVKKIIESYGGQIWVTSQVGQGSTFFFTLPH